MSFIPKNIFFYWTGSDVPNEIKTNIRNYKVINSAFNVQIITNDNDVLENTDNIKNLYCGFFFMHSAMQVFNILFDWLL